MAYREQQLYCSRVQEDKALCSACMVAAQGLNCWEVDAAPCCRRPRETCTDCIVYIGYLRATSTIARVVVALTDGRVLQGSLSIRAGQRLSDALNTPGRQFLVVRDVRWLSEPPTGSPPAGSVLFLAARAILWAAPLTEPAGEGGQAPESE
ncbi:MAG: hypothetical protein H5T86_08220 [Armatimonadetes bacterium]|nr:hypothetical protein [Armatimonadota bacterium]